MFYGVLWKSTLPGSCVVFSSGYNLNGVKQKICVVCNSLCHTFAEVNLKGLFSVFYFYKSMADLCYKDTL